MKRKQTIKKRVNAKKAVSKEQKWSSGLCSLLVDIGIWIFKALASYLFQALIVKAFEQFI